MSRHHYVIPMSNVIDKFQGRHGFLSNFTTARVTLDGYAYPSVENAFQAAKVADPSDRRPFLFCSAADAKKLGRRAELRPDWEEVKVDVMLGLLRQKFAEPTLRAQLLATGDSVLVEGNWWGDTFWGVCRGEGQNYLGKLLMKVREELRAEPAPA